MAQKIIHRLVDDIDGTELDPGKGETIHFSLDGKAYEIDLSSAHAEELRAALAQYVGAGRRTNGGKPRRPARHGGSRDLDTVRSWARENGHTVSDRGRVPDAVLRAFDAAN